MARRHARFVKNADGRFNCVECGTPGAAVVAGAPCLSCVRNRRPRTYLALSPCGTVVKIGRAKWPEKRMSGYDLRCVERSLGIGHVSLFRVYPADVERECLAFMLPDRVRADGRREWFRVTPRFRVLVSRLDRQFAEIARSAPPTPQQSAA